MGLRLGAPLSEPHSCKLCGADVNSTAVHGLSCKYSKGRHPRHSAINVIIQKALSSINVPSKLEPSGLYRSDGKRPDGASIIPWKSGKALVWDFTCTYTLALSYQSLSTRESGAAADEAEWRKQKYSHLDTTHHFVPIAIETLGVLVNTERP